MHTKKTKILVPTFGTIVRRGVENFEINLYNHLNHEEFAVDFITSGRCENKSFYTMVKPYHDKVIEYGIDDNTKIFNIKSFLVILKYMRENDYDVVHINAGNISVMAYLVLAAYMAKIPVIIVHARNGGKLTLKHRTKRILTYPILNFLPTRYLTVSDIAAKYEFPSNKISKTIMIKNGTDIGMYAYNKQKRKRVRNEYGIEKKFVIGHVGAFTEQKNHSFLLKVFSLYLTKHSDAVLVLIGADGPEKIHCVEYIHDLRIENNVILVGKSDEVDSWYSAFDFFLFPSLYEGFPNCMVEAQANGLSCIISKNVTREALLLDDRVSYLSITDEHSANSWARRIDDMRKMQIKRQIDERFMREFDIEHTAEEMMKLYRLKK